MVFRYWSIPIATAVTHSFLCQWNVLYERYRSLCWGEKEICEMSDAVKENSLQPAHTTTQVYGLSMRTR
jgi:hypothetical protein